MTLDQIEVEGEIVHGMNDPLQAIRYAGTSVVHGGGIEWAGRLDFNPPEVIDLDKLMIR